MPRPRQRRRLDSTSKAEVIRFDHFMQDALHHPQHGYYARNISTVGPSGDFSTTATLSNILGKAIAAAYSAWLEKDKTHRPHLIEIGAGDGSLARSILKSLPFFTRLKTHYHIVDSSTPLREKQQATISRKRKTHWHAEIESALDACGGNAFIFSNELVDAFPVRIFEQSNNTLTELYIEGGKELFKPTEAPEIYASALENLKENQRVELHQSYQQWLSEWLPNWHTGEILTIDYGDTFPAIYYRMPKGSLRAYAHHQRLTGQQVYLNPGQQDITADVNFTDLIHWSESLGLTTKSFSSQAKFLTPHASDAPADQFLIHPHGAGEAFKVLHQIKEKL